MSGHRLPQHVRKTHIVSYRLTDEEYACLSERAVSINLKANEFAKRLALSRKNTLKVNTCRKHDPRLINELSRIGNNLNQMVKRLHMTGTISARAIDLCDRIEALIDEALSEEGLE